MYDDVYDDGSDGFVLRFDVSLVSGFIRGDITGDGSTALDDALFLLSALFVPDSPLVLCLDAADVNDDGSFQLTDPIWLLNYLFVPASPPPAEPVFSCGLDPTSDLLGCLLAPQCP